MTTRANIPPGERVFRALMRLYPRLFRDRFLDEMVDFYRARRAEQRQRRRGVARFWLHLLADIAVNAPLQHVHAFRVSSARDLPWASPQYPHETHPMDNLRHDVRYAVRSLMRHPGFAVVAAITLALGIGATTTIYSVVDAVLLRPLPWPDADRLVMIYGTRGDGQRGGVVYLDFEDWRARSRSFDALGVIRGQSVNLTGGDQPDRLVGSFVTAGTFEVLGASARMGRLFSGSETEVVSRQPVAVISEPLWRTRYGARPDILGTKLVLNGDPFTVVGVMREGFQAPLGTPDVWLPVGYYPNRGDLTTRGRPGVIVVGRLRESVSVGTAQAELDGIMKELAAVHTENLGGGAAVLPLEAEIRGDARSSVLIVFGAVATVLLIACANVANLNIARAASRRRELSVRAALGAGRRRLVMQLLTESLVLASVGGLAGLGIAVFGVRWFAEVVPNLLPLYGGDVTLSSGVLWFAATLTMGAAIAFGVAPAWRASRVELQHALGARTGGGETRLAGRRLLVGAEIALCVVLLVCAGLLTRSLFALAAVNPGFDASRILTLQFRLPASKYDSEARIAGMFERTIAEIRAVPGVESAALVRATPLNGNGERRPYQLQGVGETDPARLPSAHVNIITSGYFATMRIPTRAGRDFADQDRAVSQPVAIVNEHLARRIEPSGDVLGRQIRVMDSDEPQWRTIVGVVANAHHFSLSEPPFDQVYLPVSQKPLIFTEVVVRTSSEPMLLANAVRSAIWRVDRDQPVWGIRPLLLSMERALDGRRFTMYLLGAFAALALVLASVGVYGVMSYMVVQRTQEMGIRMALGARPRQVLGMVLGEATRTVGLAVVAGLAGAYASARLLETQLYGVERADPLTYVAAPLVLAAVALLACWVPARRASRVDPLGSLRAD